MQLFANGVVNTINLYHQFVPTNVINEFGTKLYVEQGFLKRFFMLGRAGRPEARGASRACSEDHQIIKQLHKIGAICQTTHIICYSTCVVLSLNRVKSASGA